MNETTPETSSPPAPENPGLVNLELANLDLAKPKPENPASEKQAQPPRKRRDVRKKARADIHPEMAKMRVLWCEVFSEADRERWRERFVSEATQADTRKELAALHGVHFESDLQLTNFRIWVAELDGREYFAEKMTGDMAQVEREHPNWTLDQVRTAVIKLAYKVSLAGGDFKLGLKTVDSDVKMQRMLLAREIHEDARSKAAPATNGEGTVAALTREEELAEYQRIFGRTE